MNKKTHKATIEGILRNERAIDNLRCIHNGITTRLGAVIFVLKNEGWVFDDDKSGFIGDSKNWRYVLKYTPEEAKAQTTLRPEVVRERMQQSLLK